MEKETKKNGISLIVLVITILVMIILAGVVIVTMSENNPIKKAKEAAYKEDMRSFVEELGVYVANMLAIQADAKVENVDAATYADMRKVIASFQKKYTGKVEVLDGKLVYAGNSEEEEKWASACGIGIKKAGENAPEVTSGMLPVKFANGKWVVCTKEDPEWYSYGTKKWANVMLLDGKYKEGTPAGTVVEDSDLGSMYVWIPRFAYSMDSYKKKSKFTVSFLSGTTDADKRGKVHAREYSSKDVAEGSSTPSIVHPAFNIGGKELTGFWMAKFEGSKAGVNNNTIANNDTYDNIKILPGKNSWRYLQISRAMVNAMTVNNTGNIYGLVQEETDSCLPRNRDWGAVCYLANSIYGENPKQNTTKTNISGVTYTNVTGGEDYKVNTNQSTTGNVTGIYDMAGGAIEYVAAYYANNNSSISTFGSSYYFPENKVSGEFAKYIDEYTASAEEISLANTLWQEGVEANAKRLQIANARYQNGASKKGDAMYEVNKEGLFSFYGKLDSGEYGWLVDVTSANNQYGSNVYNTLAMYGNTALPFIVRGGSWDHVGKVDMFAHSSTRGASFYEYGYRVMLYKK